METQQQSEFPALDRFLSIASNSNEVGLVPYAEVEGKWTVSDGILLNFARSAVRDGTFETVFRGSAITGPPEFVQAMKEPANVPVFFFLGTDPIGVAWLNHHSGTKAFAHFLFLRKAWGEHTLKAGRVGLEYWFSFRVGDEPLFDVILGLIPSDNRRAIGFVRRLGFSVLGEIPKMFRFGDTLSGTVVYLAR